ncbi:type II toxin-antitoxin system PemK/MazF family toxin [Scytonema hofmannii FACHB-248]|uniref:Type II toxin-antitoxin system PemK/MazF family toxin n=1 Tax=Scytonema hofmannii FACHB-248 TaxID=1842502 RepID=A0ABR8GX98_9CYAN|nr:MULTISPECIES: type II toxin-antitoxin system PemK/MazF family toxin [Nostocales]MBD2607685.1 type II toxin-antitoxin system PemK/MazF family toxin [Scytonema hofmannii FACHB-248]
MQNYQSGSVLLLKLPFSDTVTFKLRPVLLLLDTGDDDVIVARITSQITQIAFDVEIIEWQQAGLMRPSVVRLHKINTVEKRLLERQLGTLQPNDWEKVRQRILQIWSSLE